MKIAFTGKGGTGKTTLSAILIKILAEDSNEILAVDCDPDSNFGYTLGFKDIDKIVPIVEMKDLIYERMNVSSGGAFFKLNPKIDDIPEKYSRQKENIKLIVMGGIKKGGSGCACPENAFVKSLIEHLVLRRNEDVVMDMEAGVEHFGRGTAQSCDSVLVVVEPSQKSLDSAKRINLLAKHLKIRNIYAIGNKIRTEKDKEFILDNLRGHLEVIENMPFSEDILRMDKAGDISNIGNDFINRMKLVEEVLSKQLKGEINGQGK